MDHLRCGRPDPGVSRPEVVVFQIKCPLGHILEIDATHIGQRLMCPMCQAVVHVSPAKPGEAPGAKYEVQCIQGHILRVKQKYLGKEVRCPSCQQLVSMKASHLLTADGSTLGQAKPELFKKKAAPPPARKAPPPPPVQVGSTEPTVKYNQITVHKPAERIPRPPAVLTGESNDDPAPLIAEVVKEPTLELQPLPVEPPQPPPALLTAATVHEDEFEFEVVDTQFHMELEKSGMEAPKAAPIIKKSRSGRLTGPGSGRIAPPPVREEPPEALVLPPPAELVDDDVVPAPPPVQKRAPTGLHNLSGSEMMQVQIAALQQEELATLQFTCPNGHALEVEARFRGMHIQCPVCKKVFQLPG